MLFRLFPLLLTAVIVCAQSCENYGTQNGSSCACPPGFGGSTCSQPGCGGNIFQGSQRPLTPLSGSPSVANLSAAGCQCSSGWTGEGCNVCQSASACQTGFSGVATSSETETGADGLNSTITCSTTPQVWAASQMSCQVINPTLQALFPGSSNLNILRTLQPSLTPLPNVTAFGTAGYASAQLFYNGVEQFYCQADSCSQDLHGGDGSADWACQNLQCTCRPGTTFCSGVADLTQVINALGGALGILCDAPDNSTHTSTCHFTQSVLESLFGSSGLTLNACTFGECVRQSVIDSNSASGNTGSSSDGGKSLSGGVIAGLAVVGALLFLALVFLLFGLIKQRSARKASYRSEKGGVGVEWLDVSYFVPTAAASPFSLKRTRRRREKDLSNDKVVLDCVSGRVIPGQMMAILGPSGAGKTTLVEILAGKSKSGHTTGVVTFPRSNSNSRPTIGFVPQQDVLPPILTVSEALLFAARLRLPDSVTDADKVARVQLLMEKLGIASLRDTRIGWGGDVGGKARGISGGEMRRVSIGLELIASPDVLILDEPTSGLDSVSAAKVTNVLQAIAHDPVNPTVVIASIHQPSSKIYQTFDNVLLLSHGRAIYSGPGLFAPVEYLTQSRAVVPPFQQGYNVADYLLEVASDPPVDLFQMQKSTSLGDVSSRGNGQDSGCKDLDASEKGIATLQPDARSHLPTADGNGTRRSAYATTFLTQLEVLAGREWKILKRDKTLFFTHVAVASVLGVFCGGLYFHTDVTIAGFQSRVGCLFFLGALIAFSSLSALYNVVEIRPLFLRERSSSYYSPTAWLLSRFLFDVIPLRIIPTIIVSTITYWMAGLAHDAAHFFKFLFILVLYTLAMTLYNFLLGTLFQNGGIAILLSALSALYQMTFAGFFVHLNSIPPVLRWLQWLCPLKYTLEALAVNEVGSGLMIQDSLQGVPVDVSASLIMNLLFGFGANNYYRDVLVLFAFIAGFGVGVIGVVWLRVRERR